METGEDDEGTPVNFLKGSRSGIPESGIPSDWPNLTPPVNTRELLTQPRNVIWCARMRRSSSIESRTVE